MPFIDGGTLRDKLRVLFAGIAVVGGGITGLTHFGGNPVVPGKAVNLERALLPDGSGFSFWIEAGRIECVARFVVVRVSADTAVAWRAELVRGESLTVTPTDSAGLWILDVTRGPRPPDTTGNQAFRWHVEELRLVGDGIAQPLVETRLVDWEVAPIDGRLDTRGRAAARRAWFWISLIVFFAALLAAVGNEVLKRREPERLVPLFTAERCITQMIENIDLGDVSRTRLVRQVLLRVVLGGEGEEAVIKALLPDRATQYEQMRLGFLARSQFDNQWTALTGRLKRYRQLFDRA